MQPEVIGGRYRVRSAIGQGGMGTVWLARDERLERDVAIKQVGLLPGESVTDSARALREARSSAALSHRNLVTVFDVVEENGVIWLVMEYVPSRALSEIIRDEGRLPPERVAAIGAQIADALATTHAAGTTHRDVKPGNVLVTDDGTAKLTDFGIARREGDPALTQSGFVTGTPGYFSPELATGAHPGPAGDVWALGATLYAAVEGRPPYPPNPNPVATLREIATRQPDRPQHAGPLEQPLRRMLDRDPGSRWSMADAAHALRRVADRHSTDRTRENTVGTASPVAAAAGTGAGSEPTTPTRPSEPARPREDVPPAPPPASGRPRRRRGGVYAALAVAALLLVIGGIAYAASLRDEPPRESASGGSSQASPESDAAEEPSESAGDGSDGDSSGKGSGPSKSKAPAKGAGSRAEFLKDYFATAPNDRDAGWAMLGPNERSVGRASYDRFWGSIDSVDVGRIKARGDQVELELTYHYSDGRVVAERQRLQLVKGEDGSYLIDDDTVLSSRTVS